jgi:hypothetical protein
MYFFSTYFLKKFIPNKSFNGTLDNNLNNETIYSVININNEKKKIENYQQKIITDLNIELCDNDCVVNSFDLVNPLPIMESITKNNYLRKFFTTQTIEYDTNTKRFLKYIKPSNF